LKMDDRKHSICQGILVGELYAYFRQHRIGKVLPEFSLRLWPESRHNLRTPDIAVSLNENLHEEEKYETNAPDLAIEIVSDDDKVSAVRSSLGIRHANLPGDPAGVQLECYRDFLLGKARALTRCAVELDWMNSSRTGWLSAFEEHLCGKLTGGHSLRENSESGSMHVEMK